MAKLTNLIFLSYLLVITFSQPTIKDVFQFSPTQFSEGLLQQAYYEFKWIAVSSQSSQSNQVTLKQTSFERSKSNNKSETKLTIDGNWEIKAISQNLTCAILSSTDQTGFAAYTVNAKTKAIKLFHNMSSLENLQSEDKIKVSQNCLALRVNDQIYHYNTKTSKYDEDTLPFELNSNIYLDHQLSVLASEDEIYFYNKSSSRYESKLKNQDFYSFRFITRSLKYPQRMIIYTGGFYGDYFDFYYNVSFYQLQNNTLKKLKQISKSTTFNQLPDLRYDSSLSTFFLYVNKNLKPEVTVFSAYYNYNVILQIQSREQFSSFLTQPSVSLSPNYIYVRQKTQNTDGQIRELLYQRFVSHLFLIHKRVVSPTQNHIQTVIQQKNQSVSILALIRSDDSYLVQEQIVNKQVSSGESPNKDLFQFTYPRNQNTTALDRSIFFPKWMYSTYDGKTNTTTFLSISYNEKQQNNTLKVKVELKDDWYILSQPKNFSCLAVLELNSFKAKILNYNYSSKIGEQIADISSILTAEGVKSFTNTKFKVSSTCQFFKIGSSIYHYNGSKYINTSLLDQKQKPASFVNATFDQSFKIAVINGSMFEYMQSTNRYQLVYTPSKQKPFLTSSNIFFNKDKVIIISTTSQYFPKSMKYKVDCFWTNGTKWTYIDLKLEGSCLQYRLNYALSPNFQFFTIEGMTNEGIYTFQGRIIPYRNIVQFKNASVKNMSFPEELLQIDEAPFVRLSDNFMYLRRLVTVNNYEAVYKLNKQKGQLELLDKRNLTLDEQLIWKNVFISQVNNSAVILIQSGQTGTTGTVSLVKRVIEVDQNPQGNAKGTILIDSLPPYLDKQPQKINLSRND